MQTLADALRAAPWDARQHALVVVGPHDRWHLGRLGVAATGTIALDTESMRRAGYFRTWRYFDATQGRVVRDCVLHYPRDIFTRAWRIDTETLGDPPGFLLTID